MEWSLEHEELVELFLRDLSLAIELTRATGKVQIPDYDTLEAGPAEVRELVPASLRVDAVVLLRKSKPVMVILVEVQLGRDEYKPYSWPFYVAGRACATAAPWCSWSTPSTLPSRSGAPAPSTRSSPAVPSCRWWWVRVRSRG